MKHDAKTDTLKCDKNIGEVIRRIREERKIKQSDVIRYMQLNGLQITKSAYSKIEANKQHIKISELCLLKKYFKVSYDDFFKSLEE